MINNRPIAVKTIIKEILIADYLQEEEGTNYLLTPDQKKIYRLNLMAIILEKEIQGNITNFLLDDGTSTIVLRSFEDNKKIRELNVGDVIITIGKLRIYNQEKYISPEIIKKIDPDWLKIRAKEMESLIQKISKRSSEIEINTQLIKQDNKDNVIKENIKEEKVISVEKSDEFEEFGEIEEVMIEEKNELLPNQKIFQLIKEMDSGSGVAIEEIIHKSSLKDTEIIIQKMLEKGDIFQNSPGKIKVL